MKKILLFRPFIFLLLVVDFGCLSSVSALAQNGRIADHVKLSFGWCLFNSVLISSIMWRFCLNFYCFRILFVCFFLFSPLFIWVFVLSYVVAMRFSILCYVKGKWKKFGILSTGIVFLGSCSVLVLKKSDLFSPTLVVILIYVIKTKERLLLLWANLILFHFLCACRTGKFRSMEEWNVSAGTSTSTYKWGASKYAAFGSRKDK